MTNDLGQLVREFHTKYGFPLDKPLSQQNTLASGDSGQNGIIAGTIIKKFGVYLQHQAEALKERAEMYLLMGDGRLYRMFKMTEEFGEMLVRMAEQNELEFAHEAGDLAYTLFGTCEQFGISLHQVVLELHKANMTKDVSAVKDRQQAKLGSYVAPDIKGALERGRDERLPKLIIADEIGRPRERDTLR